MSILFAHHVFDGKLVIENHVFLVKTQPVKITSFGDN